MNCSVQAVRDRSDGCGLKLGKEEVKVEISGMIL